MNSPHQVPPVHLHIRLHIGDQLIAGYGREGGQEGLSEFLRTKAVSIA